MTILKQPDVNQRALRNNQFAINHKQKGGGKRLPKSVRRKGCKRSKKKK